MEGCMGGASRSRAQLPLEYTSVYSSHVFSPSHNFGGLCGFSSSIVPCWQISGDVGVDVLSRFAREVKVSSGIGRASVEGDGTG